MHPSKSGPIPPKRENSAAGENVGENGKEEDEGAEQIPDIFVAFEPMTLILKDEATTAMPSSVPELERLLFLDRWKKNFPLFFSSGTFEKKTFLFGRP